MREENTTPRVRTTTPGPTDDPQNPGDTIQLAPHDIAAERYVLGAAMQSAKALNACQKLLTPNSFYTPAHETIWRALLDLQAQDKPTEPQALSAYLIDAGTINRVGGAPYLFDCIQDATTPASAPYYAERIDRLDRRRTATAAVRKAHQRLANPGPDSDVDQLLTELHEGLAQTIDAIADPHTPSTWAPLDIEPALAGQHLDPPPQILRRTDGQPLFYTGSVHSISGESESAKTWVTLLAAVQEISNNNNVIFIDFEDRADRVVGRLQTLGATNDHIRSHFTYIRPHQALNTTNRQDLAPYLPTATLCIIDGVTEAMTVHGFETNDNGDAARFYALLPRWIADHGPATVLIDHVAKDAEKRGRYALGAQHKLAGLDGAAFGVKVITPFGRGKRGLSHITIAKDRPGHIREHAHGHHIADFILDSTNPDHTLCELNPPEQISTTDDGTWAPTVLMERISKFVYGNPGATQRNIFDAVRGGKDTHKRLAVDLLIRRGYINLETGPNRAKQHHHIKPFPDETETPK